MSNRLGCGCLTLIIIGIIIIISLPSLDKNTTNNWGQIKYVHTPTNIRSMRSSKSEITGVLKTNEKVKVDFLKNNWYAVFKTEEAVKDTNKALGYVYAPLLKPKPLKKEPLKKKITSVKDEKETNDKSIIIPSARSYENKDNWYSGGTLHNKTALDWQIASEANKLATCADFITKASTSGIIKESLRTKLDTTKEKYIQELRPFAEELVDFIDAATEKDNDPILNQKLFANQKVSEIAIMGMMMMDWMK